MNQVGSHVILQTDHPAPHRISVPSHHALRVGTLAAILRDVAVAKGVTRETILFSL
ncbi:MAG: hypothetical protein ACREHV_04425 [Rhizomicrobium sp.]